MPLKNILVHLDISDHAAARLSLAVSLAQKHQARLTALYIITHPYYEPLHIDTGVRAQQVENQFNEITAATGIQAELLTIDWKHTAVAIRPASQFRTRLQIPATKSWSLCTLG